MSSFRSCVLASFWIPFGFSFFVENTWWFYITLALLITLLALISVTIGVRVNSTEEAEQAEDFEGILWM